MRGNPPPFIRGDRVLYVGIGQLRGKHADVLSVHRDFAGARCDEAGPVLCLACHLHPIPRRPRPDF